MHAKSPRPFAQIGFALLTLFLGISSAQAYQTKAFKSEPVAAQMANDATGVDFAHSHSDLLPDPNIRFGKLPNGMTYIIMKNATPPNTASLRLRIGAGAMMERDDQSGLAHFTEHMAFNGSKNVPEGEMVKMLERHGLAFGPDTNAYTNFSETVYQLDLPKANDEMLDTGLFIMHETAANLSLNESAIIKERGVIAGEERLRDQPVIHAYLKYISYLYDGQLYPKRWPIGKPEIFMNAPRQAFVDFYETWYRPELATLIVVGDIDVDATEAKIIKMFGDWKPARNEAIPTVDFGAYKAKPANALTYAEKGLGKSINIVWTKAQKREYQTYESVREDWTFQMASAALNERYSKASRNEDAAFSAAGIYKDSAARTADSYVLDITPKPGREKEAFAQAYEIYRQFIAFGATQGELDRALENTETAMKAAVEGEKTRSTTGLAASLVDAVGNLTVISSPAQDYALFQDLKPKMTLEAVNEGFKKTMSSTDGPFIWYTAEDLGGVDAAALMATKSEVDQKPLVAQAETAKKAWPYTDFGKATKLIKREESSDLGVVVLTYANGVRVVLKSTDFKKDQVLVKVRFGGGLKSIGPKQNAPILISEQLGVYEGGLNKLTTTEINDSLNGKVFGVNMGLDEDALTLQGSTTHTDFGTQMQVLMAFATDAAYRPDALDRLKTFLPDLFTRINASPNGVFGIKSGQILHNGDARFGVPSLETLSATPNEAVKALIQGHFEHGPIEIVIVGDVTEAEARAEVEKTFATLPKRADKAISPKGADVVTFPEGPQKHVFTHKGRADQGLAVITFKGPDFWSDRKRARVMQIMSSVLNLRLTDEVREKKALAYSPNAGANLSLDFKDYGYVTISAAVAPDKFNEFYATVDDIIMGLATTPISEDELLRARKPMLESYENGKKTNEYWFGVLEGASRNPLIFDNIRTRARILMSITPEDIQMAAKTYLNMKKAIIFEIVPEEKK